MMTGKQKWFIEKLIKEIEEMTGATIDAGDTFYGSAAYDSYAVSKADASADITNLLRTKELVADGKSLDEALAIASREYYSAKLGVAL